MSEVLLVIALVFTDGLTENMSFVRPNWTMDTCRARAKEITWAFSNRPEIASVRVTCRRSASIYNM